MIVCKFGGTSVVDESGLRRLHAIVAARRSEKPFVVVSALAGVSDALFDACGNSQRADTVKALEQRHLQLVTAVAGREAVSSLDTWLEALRYGPPDPADTVSVAEWVALGELLSSAIVAAALEAWGLPARWFDVRQVMRTQGNAPLRDSPHGAILQRLVNRHLRPELAGDRVVVTQGFIGCDSEGRTTLLGRGGSDLSASLLGAATQAARIEIWTDVDGVLTGPPHVVPAARRIKVLSFDEAAELAYFGAKVLHPASIRPAQEAAIPVFVANARRARADAVGHDDPPGTLILADISKFQDERSVVRSVVVKHGVTVLTVHSTRMLGAHGFLQRIFAVFAQHETPVDLVSTSEVSVSLTVDEPRALDGIVTELQQIARVVVAPNMAIVCIVGEGMRRSRGIAARIFRAVGGTEVRMISQGASEINVSLVVNSTDADAVVRRLHDEFFGGILPGAVFGEAYCDLELAHAKHTQRVTTPHRLARVAHELATSVGTPFYVYELDGVERQIERLRSVLRHPRARVAYACKANFHPAIFGLMQTQGIGIDAVSPMEAERALECGIPARDILFTANNVGMNQLLSLHDRGVRVNLGSPSDVRRFADERRNTDVWLRLNPGVGEGHHANVVTGGLDSKFGMLEEDVRAAVAVLARSSVRVVGLHAHIGSGISEPEPLLESCRRLVRVAAELPDVCMLNVGGGIGVPHREDDPEFDLAGFGTGLDEIVRDAEHSTGRELHVWVEPGRFLVAHAGTLVATVTCRKVTAGHVYIGLDTGMNHLVRPALYGSYHTIRNLSAPDAPLEFVDVVGNICESSDVFALGRPLPSAQEGHLLAICDTGAYGYAMASHYNLWPLPREVVTRDGKVVQEPFA